jgi:glycogen debranching enzyme
MAAAAESFEYRLPELFGGMTRSRGEGPRSIQQACDLQAWAAGAPSLLLRTLFGMEPDAASGILRLDPHLSPDAGPLEVSNIRVGSSIVALRAEGMGPTTYVKVLSQEGPPLRIKGAA